MRLSLRPVYGRESLSREALGRPSGNIQRRTVLGRWQEGSSRQRNDATDDIIEYRNFSKWQNDLKKPLASVDLLVDTPEAPDGRFVCHRFSLRLQYRFETHNHRCRLTPDPDASDACGWLAHP